MCSSLPSTMATAPLGPLLEIVESLCDCTKRAGSMCCDPLASISGVSQPPGARKMGRRGGRDERGGAPPWGGKKCWRVVLVVFFPRGVVGGEFPPGGGGGSRSAN